MQDPPSVSLQVRLLGDFSLMVGSEAILTLNTPRLQSLLGYLLLHRNAPQLRSHLAFTFWPDSSETQAHNNFRKALHLLRSALLNADRHLSTDAKTVQWRPDAPTTLNVADFEAALHRADAQRQDDQAALEDAPQAALVYAAIGVVNHDAIIACFDAKYAYWAIRPNQLDPEVKPLFNTPNHPSYPAAHACASHAMATVLAHFFPADAPAILVAAEEAGLSRIAGGIHYRSDVEAGKKLGQEVAQAVLARIEEMK